MHQLNNILHIFFLHQNITWLDGLSHDISQDVHQVTKTLMNSKKKKERKEYIYI